MINDLVNPRDAATPAHVTKSKEAPWGYATNQMRDHGVHSNADATVYHLTINDTSLHPNSSNVLFWTDDTSYSTSNSKDLLIIAKIFDFTLSDLNHRDWAHHWPPLLNRPILWARWRRRVVTGDTLRNTLVPRLSLESS